MNIARRTQNVSSLPSLLSFFFVGIGLLGASGGAQADGTLEWRRAWEEQRRLDREATLAIERERMAHQERLQRDFLEARRPALPLGDPTKAIAACTSRAPKGASLDDVDRAADGRYQVTFTNTDGSGTECVAAANGAVIRKVRVGQSREEQRAAFLASDSLLSDANDIMMVLAATRDRLIVCEWEVETYPGPMRSICRIRETGRRVQNQYMWHLVDAGRLAEIPADSVPGYRGTGRFVTMVTKETP